mmetsp:Transcript_12672/g.27372  ORF Transcript_12672/g.27372 Transcript_12672/m.27372 type:complete len:89 (-) Transcript_12672:470-736(-)
MPVMDVAFLELNVCTHVLAVLPMDLSMAYWASQGQHFLTHLRKPKEDIIMCEMQVHQQQMLLDELCVKVGMKPKCKKYRGGRNIRNLG